MLQVQQLCKSFGPQRVVHQLSFEVAAGEIVALIGPNGAGKSTTFHMLHGQLSPDSGCVVFQGSSLKGLSASAVARRGIARTFQIAQLFDSFSVIENVQIARLSQAGLIYRCFQQARRYQPDQALYWLTQVGLGHRAHDAASSLAYGDVKRLELAMALACQPQLLLMDEPTAGMASAERHALMALIQQLVDQHQLAVLFTEHSMDVVFGFAQRILVMSRGELIAQGSPQSIRDDAQVQALYLGPAALTSAGVRP
jgi:ABC-type branched-subunit amino acid transport system ATPase component